MRIRRPHTRGLEPDTHPELELPGRKCRGKGQRSIGDWLDRTAHVKVLGAKEGLPARVFGQPETRAHHVVHTGEVESVKEVETFSHKLDVSLFRHLDPAGDAHIERHEVRTEASVARSPDGTVVSGVTISIYVSAGQQVEGMTAVVTEDRSELESGSEAPES